MTSKKRISVIFILLCLFAFNSYGQRIKYRDVKDDISIENYRQKIENQKYSPTVAGVCNYLIPSSGYFYVGEPIRGACVLGAELVTSSICITGLVMSMSVNSETGQSPEGARALMLSGIIATGLIHYWSVFDVVKISKIKNLASQESNISVMIEPDIFINKQIDRNLTTYGLRLSLSFWKEIIKYENTTR